MGKSRMFGRRKYVRRQASLTNEAKPLEFFGVDNLPDRLRCLDQPVTFNVVSDDGVVDICEHLRSAQQNEEHLARRPWSRSFQNTMRAISERVLFNIHSTTDVCSPEV